MRRVIALSIIVLLIAFGSCKKPCYTCTGWIISPYRIDTFSYYGQIRYDTTDGNLIGFEEFTTCDKNSAYHYGNITQGDGTKTDTLIDCQQNNY